MIVKDIKKKIIINFSISIVFVLITAGLFIYLSRFKENQDKQIAYVKQVASQIATKASDYQNKAQETKKYIEVWKTIPDNKKNFSGVKIDDLNGLLSKLSEKYYISNQSVKVSLPEDLKGGVFDRKTLYVSYADVTISFNAINDILAISFLSDFLKELNGYLITTKIDIKKDKKYTSQDLVDISSSKSSGNVMVKFSFAWYAYHKKEDTDKINPNNAPIISNTQNHIPDSNKSSQ